MRLLSLSFLCVAVFVVLLPQARAFGAGNIASISTIEGRNWRHGDIEDTLKGLAHLRGYKWNSMNIKRVYFGNWLRDYSQAVDVGSLKGVPAETIRLLLWVLAFMTFGYCTAEFEVTAERLGCYRPEEHIDNPKGYADGEDARKYDPRLRGPVMPEELEIDPNSGMKNYIANERGNWATSMGYVKFSLSRAIHYGRIYKHGSAGASGQEADLFEAFRSLGQALHCLEDFGAHSNYVELVLIELGHQQVFPHVGTNTRINLHGKSVYPLVTGTFGGVDFLHSVIGEANDHVTQSEVEEMATSLNNAQGGSASRGDPGAAQQASGLIDLLSKVPGTGDLIHQARALQQDSEAQAQRNSMEPSNLSRGFESSDRGFGQDDFSQQNFGQYDQPRANVVNSAQNIDVQAIFKKIYPIMVFRDNVVRTISGIVSKIPGLESLIEKISERVTMFVMSLLAPYILPVIRMASTQLKTGSSAVIKSSANTQFEVWSNPSCSDPTHSMLSKDHFSNILNQPAGQVASTILQHVVPRIVESWENPNEPADRVIEGAIAGIFHHPAARSRQSEIQSRMFEVVQKWVQSMPDRGAKLDRVLGSESVKNGGNHKDGQNPHMTHGNPSVGAATHSSSSVAGAGLGGGIGGMIGSFLPGQGQGQGNQNHAGGGIGGMIDSFIPGQNHNQGGYNNNNNGGGIGGMLESFLPGQGHRTNNNNSGGLGGMLESFIPGQSHGNNSGGIGGMINQFLPGQGHGNNQGGWPGSQLFRGVDDDNNQQRPEQYNNAGGADYYQPGPPNDAPFAAAPRPGDANAYPTAYQQGYEPQQQESQYGQFGQGQGGYEQGQGYGGQQGYNGQQGYGGQEGWEQRRY